MTQYGGPVLRAVLLSAGSEGPRSVIPNLAELLASLVGRVKGEIMAGWLQAILSEVRTPVRVCPRGVLNGSLAFLTPRRLMRRRRSSRLPFYGASGSGPVSSAYSRSRTSKKMREALHEFALIARGLHNTTYGNATGMN